MMKDLKHIKKFNEGIYPEDMSEFPDSYHKDEVTSLCWKLFSKTRNGDIKDWKELNSYVEGELLNISKNR